ncbi:hypothetical protein [Deinococcus sp.]|uniref:hypothetical protein n=1 Tax=Deinococcus sp. TaxID=47478 RepID=UPI003B59AC23
MHRIGFKSALIAASLPLLLAACSQTALPASDAAAPADNMVMGFEAGAQPSTILANVGWDAAPLQSASVKSKHEKQIRSSLENRDSTLVALPLYQGKSNGKPFWFVVTEASNKMYADGLGVNLSPKLEFAKGTAAVQKGWLDHGKLNVPAGVDFSPTNSVVPGPNVFPPASFSPGAVGEAGYSPLVSLPGGVVLNASQVANSSGVSDKVAAISYRYRYVVLKLSKGLYEDDGIKTINYLSLDSSGDLASALEQVTYAPSLSAAPGIGSNDETVSARSGIAIFTNGQTGAGNPNRQGLTSALLGEGGPVNVTESFPIGSDGLPEPDYSPLWDAHVSTWTPAAIKAGLNTVQGDFAVISELGAAGTLTAPDGSAWGPSDFIVNCPGVSIDR